MIEYIFHSVVIVVADLRVGEREQIGPGVAHSEAEACRFDH